MVSFDREQALHCGSLLKDTECHSIELESKSLGFPQAYHKF